MTISSTVRNVCVHERVRVCALLCIWGDMMRIITLSPMSTLVKLSVCRWELEPRMAGAMVSISSFSKYWPTNGHTCCSTWVTAASTQSLPACCHASRVEPRLSLAAQETTVEFGGLCRCSCANINIHTDTHTHTSNARLKYFLTKYLIRIL